MKILFAVAEAHPFVKTGGLGDVAGTLPIALKKEGIDVRCVLPRYQTIPDIYQKSMKFIASFNVSVGWRNQKASVYKLENQGIIYYFLENDYYFNRPELYGYYDEAERFAFFSRGLLEMLKLVDFQADIIHCHDWHTGVVALLLKAHYQHDEFYRQIKTVYTIHNLKYQGNFPKEVLGDLLGLGEEYFTLEGIEFYGAVSYMKAGLIYSNKITTVSPTYAEEIQSPYFGEGMEGILYSRRKDFIGILNGIDVEFYNPKKDPNIIPFDLENLKGKIKNKTSLQSVFGLKKDPNIPMIAMVSRLVSQKGLDLVLDVLEEILKLEVQMVVLGSGDEKYEKPLKEAYQRFPEKLAFYIGFNESLAHRIYAASDLFLMPSQFEPCGISQLIAMRYGSVPIVRETGGLKDTVESFNEFTGKGNGFSFTYFNAHDMLYTIKRAVNFYYNKEIWNKIMKEGMKKDYSWKKSAHKYIELYEQVIKMS